MRCRGPQPFAEDVMGDAGRCKRSYIPGLRQFGAPPARIEMLEYNLVHLLVCDVALRHRLITIERNRSLRSGHRIFLSTTPTIEPYPDQ
jgi:hypothetical protein